MPTLMTYPVQKREFINNLVNFYNTQIVMGEEIRLESWTSNTTKDVNVQS